MKSINVKNINFPTPSLSNIIKISFGSLLSGDITALVCFLLAFLMEIGDIVIAFVIRYEPKRPKPIIKDTQTDLYRNLKYSKTYEGY